MEQKRKKKVKVGVIISMTLTALVAAGFVAGFFALRSSLTSRFTVDKESEEQKCFFVGTYKDESYPIAVHVSLLSPLGTMSEVTLFKKDFNYNTSGQQSTDTIWCDMTSFASEATGGMRLDLWVNLGGRILFDSTQNGSTSDTKDCSWGGGAYLVHGPDEDLRLTVQYVPVTLYIVEDYVL